MNRILRAGLTTMLAGIALYPMALVAKAAAATWQWLMPDEERVPQFALGANTLTGLIPAMYAGLNVVSREMVGFISAFTRNSTADRAAVGQQVTVPIATVGAAEDITPGINPANTGDADIGSAPVTITKAKAVPIRWNGEETLGLSNAGNYEAILADQFAEAIRTLVNLVEIDCAIAAKVASSRAYGTAGTAPFATAGDMSDLAQTMKILDDNGAPTSRQIVLNSAAMANVRGKMSNLFKDNEAGTDELLRTGLLSTPLQGGQLRYSGGIQTHTKGTGAGYLVNNVSGIAVGGTTVAADTGSGTILAGDIITAAADSANKYVVGSALSGGSFSLNKPGARVLLPDNNALTVGNNYLPNFVFSRNAFVLATRAPALPKAGDAATDSMMLTDPISGLTFEVRVYAQYRQVKYEVCLAWGVNGVKPEHSAILLG